MEGADPVMRPGDAVPPGHASPPRAFAHQHVEARLLAYCAAVDSHDAASAGRLLADADLYFKEQPRLRGGEAIGGFYARAFTSDHRRTAHVIADLLVVVEAPDVFYRCKYQRWLLPPDADAPICVALGTYAGKFRDRAGVLVWTEHHVRTS